MSEARLHEFPRGGAVRRQPSWIEAHRRRGVTTLQFPERGEEPGSGATEPDAGRRPGRAGGPSEPPRIVAAPPDLAAGEPVGRRGEVAPAAPRSVRPPPHHAPFGAGPPGSTSLPLPPRAPVLDTPAPGSESMLPPHMMPGDGQRFDALDAAMQAFTDAAVSLAAAEAKTLASLEGALLDLAVDIASAIIDQRIEVEPELHGALARAALASLGDLSSARLRASREAYAAIVDTLHTSSVEVDGVKVQITLDPSIEGLGCVAENEHARVDGRIGERLRAVRRSIHEERRRRAVESVE